MMKIGFLLNSLGLGIGLATDASVVAVYNGVNENKSKKSHTLLCALTFGVLQGLMPLVGYFIGNTFIFLIEKWLGLISLCILTFLGLNTILNTDKQEYEIKKNNLTFKTIFMQGIATSLDALSAGIVFANLTLYNAIICATIIAITTFILCLIAFYIGKHFGNIFGRKAEIFGGVVLILIGIHIFITSIV